LRHSVEVDSSFVLRCLILRLLVVRGVLLALNRTGSGQVFDHLSFLLLHSDVLEVSPLGQNFHGLDVFDGCQFISVVLVATQRVEVNLFTESFVLSLHDFEDVSDLVAMVNFFIINSNDRVENGPHHFGIVNSTQMVLNVKAEDDLVKLGFFNSDSLIAKWRRQLPQKVWQPKGPHVELTHRVVLCPSVLECFNVFFLE